MPILDELMQFRIQVNGVDVTPRPSLNFVSDLIVATTTDESTNLEFTEEE